MAEFKIGGKVVCVDAGHHQKHCHKIPIKKGAIYQVVSIGNSPCCGRLMLDVGIKTKLNQYGYECGKCKNAFYIEGDILWIPASRFLPLDDFQQVTYTKILETVPIGAQ